MKKTHPLIKQAGRVFAGIGVLFHVGSSVKPPELPSTAQARDLQTQWAKNEKVNSLPSWRIQARELGEQLREPTAGEHRPPQEAERHAPETTHGTRDPHEKAMSERPPRSAPGADKARSPRDGVSSRQPQSGSRNQRSDGR